MTTLREQSELPLYEQLRLTREAIPEDRFVRGYDRAKARHERVRKQMQADYLLDLRNRWRGLPVTKSAAAQTTAYKQAPNLGVLAEHLYKYNIGPGGKLRVLVSHPYRDGEPVSAEEREEAAGNGYDIIDYGLGRSWHSHLTSLIEWTPQGAALPPLEGYALAAEEQGIPVLQSWASGPTQLAVYCPYGCEAKGGIHYHGNGGEGRDGGGHRVAHCIGSRRFPDRNGYYLLPPLIEE